MAAEQDLKLESQEEEEEKKPKSKLMLIIIILLVLLIGGGAAAFFLLSGSDDAVEETASEETEAEAEGEEAAFEPDSGPAVYHSFKDDFIVNFLTKGRQRFLQVRLAVLARDPQVFEYVKVHEPKIRNNFNSILADQDFANLRTHEGRLNLRNVLTEELKKIMKREIGHPGIDQVLYTNFVMQ